MPPVARVERESPDNESLDPDPDRFTISNYMRDSFVQRAPLTAHAGTVSSTGTNSHALVYKRSNTTRAGGESNTVNRQPPTMLRPAIYTPPALANTSPPPQILPERERIRKAWSAGAKFGRRFSPVGSKGSSSPSLYGQYSHLMDERDSGFWGE